MYSDAMGKSRSVTDPSFDHSLKREPDMYNNNAEQELISIIVPVYNVEEYLKCCIDSILRQSWSSIEVILVDDGATDSSGRICDEYAEKDARIKVIHKPNGGQSDARNHGLGVAAGSWVVFIDSDDFVSINHIENLYILHQKTNADIMVTGAYKFYNSDQCPEEAPDWNHTQVFNSGEGIENMMYRKGISIYPVAKMYRRSLFDNILFPKGMLFEDLWIEYRLFHSAEKIAFNPVNDYYYRQRSGSTINSAFNERDLIQLDIMDEMETFINKTYPEIIKSVISKYFSINCNLFCRIPSEPKYKSTIERIKKLIKAQRKTVLKDHNNKKLIRLIAFSTYISFGILKTFSRLYEWLIKKEIIHMKLPV